jgi:hypothetical protein
VVKFELLTTTRLGLSGAIDEKLVVLRIWDFDAGGNRPTVDVPEYSD